MPAQNPFAKKNRISTTATPAKPTGWRRLMPLLVRRKGGSWQIQVFWGKLAIFAIVGIVTLWIGTAYGTYLIVKYKRDYTTVKFSDILLPSRWDEYRVAHGNFMIENAKECLKTQKYREAFYQLRFGLIKAPANKEGRLLLFQFYLLWKRPDLARQTLLDGFPHHKADFEYLKSLFTFLLQQEDDVQVLQFYQKLIAEDQSVNPRNQLAALAAASSKYYRGNYDEAESILTKYQIHKSRDGRMLIARINWDRGFKDESIAQLHQLARELPNDTGVYSQLITYLRASNRDDEARREIFVRALRNPQDAKVRIDQLYAYHKDGDINSVKTNAEEILRDFSEDPNALLALADFAASTGDPSLASKIYDHAKSKNTSLEGPALMLVEAYIVAREYSNAINLTHSLLKDTTTKWSERFHFALNGLQAIAYYGLEDAQAAQLALNKYLKQPEQRAESLIAMSKKLIAVGAKTQARQTLHQAIEDYQLNQAALTDLIKLDLALNITTDLADNVRKLLTMRKPARDVLQSASDKLGSDVFLFSPDRTALLQGLHDAILKSPPSS